MQKKYIVRLTDEERRELGDVIGKLRGGSQKSRRLRILFQADADGPTWTDARIAKAFGCRRQTVENPSGHVRFHRTPKHGSWLNIVENELSVLTRQCVGGRRIGDQKVLQVENAAWSKDVNGTQRGVGWQMKVADARCKLKAVYPKLKL